MRGYLFLSGILFCTTAAANDQPQAFVPEGSVRVIEVTRDTISSKHSKAVGDVALADAINHAIRDAIVEIPPRSTPKRVASYACERALAGAGVLLTLHAQVDQANLIEWHALEVADDAPGLAATHLAAMLKRLNQPTVRQQKPPRWPGVLAARFAKGERGARVEELTQLQASEANSMSHADLAGLARGRELLSINGKVTRNEDDVRKALKGMYASDVVRLEITDLVDTIQVKVKLDEDSSACGEDIAACEQQCLSTSVHANFCAAAARVAQTKNEPNRALIFYKEACFGGHGLSCFEVARSVPSDGTNRPQKQALLERACNGGVDDACAELMADADTNHSPGWATEWARTGCKSGREISMPKACTRLVESYANGVDAPKDRLKAHRIASAACASGRNPELCKIRNAFNEILLQEELETYRKSKQKTHDTTEEQK